MRSIFRQLVSIALFGAFVVWSPGETDRTILAQDEEQTTPDPVVPPNPLAPELLGRRFRSLAERHEAHQRHKALRHRRRHHEPLPSTPGPDDPPSADASPAPAAPPGADPQAAPLSFRDRLLAKRLNRIQQLKQLAAESGDEQALQQAEFLEGMVLQLHEQGLINFAQKMISAIRDSDREAPSDSPPPADIPETDLGEAAPLPSQPPGQPEAPPELPPQDPPAQERSTEQPGE